MMELYVENTPVMLSQQDHYINNVTSLFKLMTNIIYIYMCSLYEIYLLGIKQE